MESINELFKANKDQPPLNKNDPPVAGSIRWVRSLLHRIKRTILPFLEVPEMLESEQSKVVSYFTVDTVVTKNTEKNRCLKPSV